MKATVDRTCQTHIIVTKVTVYVQKIVGKYNLSPSDLEGMATCLCCAAHEDASCWFACVMCLCCWHTKMLLAGSACVMCLCCWRWQPDVRSAYPIHVSSTSQPCYTGWPQPGHPKLSQCHDMQHSSNGSMMFEKLYLELEQRGAARRSTTHHSAPSHL